jgi:hypothetical protein
MDSHPDTRLPARLRGNFVLLRADALRLLFPQNEVGAAEYRGSTLVAAEGYGILSDPAREGSRRFAALSAQMTLLPECPADRFVVTPLGEGNAEDELGWCWNEVRVLIDVELQPHRLPAVLRAPYTPVDHYASFGGEIAYMCSARLLSAYALGQRS